MASDQPNQNDRSDGLAYGNDHSASQGTEEGAEGERGFIGDTFKKLRGRQYVPDGAVQSETQGSSSGFGSSLFNKLHGAVHGVGRQINHRLAGRDTHSHTHADCECGHGTHDNTENRYHSFAPQRAGNSIKWYVDGCGYMWAVSQALEQATQSIWILDCMLDRPFMLKACSP